MVRGKFKAKPTGRRLFSTPEEMAAGTSSRPRTFRREIEKEELEEDKKVESAEESEEESEEDSEASEKRKGTEGLIEVQNPNLLKPKTVKAKDVNFEKTSELSRRESLSRLVLA